ncbi:MAG: nucleotidyltransferase family protein [Elusimicrobiota bacterium]
MKAMILAAGLGARLRPLTDTVPKALVDLGGAPMLEIVLKRLSDAGVTEVIINAHHLADKLTDFLKNRSGAGLKIEISREVFFPLETGGGVKKAAWFLKDGGPFFLYNCDVLTDMDLKAMMAGHLKNGALATVAVKERPSARQLVFDAEMNLRGRINSNNPAVQWAGDPLKDPVMLAFSGVHVISPEIFPLMTESGVFSIVDVYLRLVKAGNKIKGFRMDGCYWQDIGNIEKLEAARRHMTEQKKVASD